MSLSSAAGIKGIRKFPGRYKWKEQYNHISINYQYPLITYILLSALQDGEAVTGAGALLAAVQILIIVNANGTKEPS